MNPYQELGLDPNCTAEQIKQQYRILAHQHHPDRGGDAERFKRISTAYEVLSDPARRAEYDQTGQIVQDNEIRNEAMSRFNNMINHYVPNSNNEIENLVFKMQVDIRTAAHQVVNEIADAQRRIHNARVAYKKIKLKTTGENILKGFVESLIAGQESTIKTLSKRQLVFAFMLEMLDNYHYGDNEWLEVLGPPIQN
jgi:curved DNA-binding protein CbpA